jgi:beta-lactamase class A
VGVNRREFAALGGGALAAPAVAMAQSPDRGPVEVAMARFAAVTPNCGGLVAVQSGGAPWEVAHRAEAPLFVGSAIKTFILAQTLREVEAGALDESAQQTIDDGVRSLISPVLGELSGRIPLRSVLEAMIAHSDNTATDIALAACGVDKVRALVGQAGLADTRVCDSTRKLFSYVAGAPLGVDLGWKGMQGIMKDVMPGPARSPMNGEETMASTARDLVKWYQASLAGRYFAKPETLIEFKRILSMGDAISQVAPPDIAAYAKGGSIDWNGFHCFAFAGQMVFGRAKASLCFAINWQGDDASVQPTFLAYKRAVSDVVLAVQKVAAQT